MQIVRCPEERRLLHNAGGYRSVMQLCLLIEGLGEAQEISVRLLLMGLG